MDTLLRILDSYDGLEYTVRTVETERAERYTVKLETEMDRRVNVRHNYVTLYRVFTEDGVKYRGSYETEIHNGAAEDEIKEIIKQGLFAADFVKNEYYPLVMPDASADTNAAMTVNAPDFGEALGEIQQAFREEDCHEQGNICYSEIFLSKNKTRIRNSNHVDVYFEDYKVYVETAVHWRAGEGKEVEVVSDFSTSENDTDELRVCLRKLFTEAEQKSKAVPMPVSLNGQDINILLSGECIPKFLGYFYQHANAQLAYQELSAFKMGEDVQGQPEGDRLSLAMDPFIRGAGDSPYDQDGLPLKRHVLIDNGKLIKFGGSTRFAHYLGIAPTGTITGFHVTGGTYTAAELRRAPYVELVSFSDFKMQGITGDFGGEIRLGYYFNGEKIIPVTGGSISGNVRDVQAALRLSSEEVRQGQFLGPAAVSMRGASLAGVE